MDKEKWVYFDVWYNKGNPHCHFRYIRMSGAIEHANSMFKSAMVVAVKIWDEQETYLYLKK